MSEYIEKRRAFYFPDQFQVQKYDETVFYDKHFKKTGKPLDPIQKRKSTLDTDASSRGTKAIDFVAFDPQQSELWLIEVKDFNFPMARISLTELIDIMVGKVIDSLAGLLAMRANALGNEQIFALDAIQKNKIRVVLHFEQPLKTSKEFPQSIDIADLKDKLKQRIRSIDPQPIISSMEAPRGVPWMVE